MYTKIKATPSILSTWVAVEADTIMVSDPLEWLAFPVGSNKRICSSFDECVVPFYEFYFTRIGLWLPFFDFEVTIMKNLKAVPS